MESKRDKFVRLAEARTNRIIDQLRLLSNCSNRHNYDYTDEDVRKIFSAIEKEVKNARGRFSGQDEESQRFTLG